MTNVYQAIERARDAERAREAQFETPRLSPVPTGRSHKFRFGAEMRTLSARLQVLFDQRKPTTILISSCGEGAGATTVASELASYLADEGRQVLYCGETNDIGVVESPTGSAANSVVATSVGTGSPPAFTRIESTARNTLHACNIRQLYGKAATARDQLLFREWIKVHATTYDVVIIDAPAVLQNQNWSVLLDLPDGIILVVEAERTRSILLETSLRAIEDGGGNVLGIVFNKRRQYIPDWLYRWL